MARVGDKMAMYPLAGADEKELRVEINGNAMPVRWSWMKAGDWAALAKSLASDEIVESQLALAVFLLADGQSSASEEAIARAAMKDAQAAAALRSTLKIPVP
jgi:hypothetical protein